MFFNSYPFLFAFLPITLAVVFGLRRLGEFRLATSALILASLFFYGWWDWRFVGLLLASAVFNWFIGGLAADGAAPRRARRALIAGIVVDLGTLALFKYGLFLSALVTGELGQYSSLYVFILPLGISFWTFEQIMYIVDCRRGQQRPLPFGDYLLFVTFFPRLIAGPIVRPQDFCESLRSWRSPISPTWMAAGLTLLAIGLFKKVCIADPLGSFVTPIFALADGGSGVGLRDAWIGTLGFTFQIYFDFSGYSDMAIGLALMLGIRLPANFDAPYKSRSIVEFWRRWHMSLSRFLRDYLYIPLGGNRLGELRRAGNVMITMGLGGLWHGAGVNYVLWGLLHGGYVNVNHASRTWLRTVRIPAAIGACLTFAAATVAWTFFRADSVSGAFTMLAGLAGAASAPAAPAPSLPVPLQLGLLAYAALHCFLLPSTASLFRPFLVHVEGEPPPGAAWRPTLSWALVAGVLFAISTWMLLDGKREFIYFQF